MSKKKLIVVADDFGFSEAYNYGVLKGYRDGIVTTLSLMSNMAAAPHAVALRDRECPTAPLAHHTNFVQYRPVSDPATIPTLVDGEGNFYRSYDWRGEDPNDPKCKGTVYPSYEDFYTETMAQLNRHKELTGSYPNHFEGHSAMTKPMMQAFLDIGTKLGIHNMAQPPHETDTMHVAFELFSTNPGAIKILNRGSSPQDWLEDRFGLLDSPYEINVLHFHPGYLDAYLLDNTSLTTPRCRDLETLCDPRVREWLDVHEIELVDFSAVYR